MSVSERLGGPDELSPVVLKDSRPLMRFGEPGGMHVYTDGTVIQNLEQYDMDWGVLTVGIYEPATGKFGKQEMWRGTGNKWVASRFIPFAFETGIEDAIAFVTRLKSTQEYSGRQSQIEDAISGCLGYLDNECDRAGRKIEVVRAELDKLR